jgi:hypothetical protein
MQRRLIWLLFSSALLPMTAGAADIYKCSGGRYVAYQNYPCPEGMDQAVMADKPRPPTVAEVKPEIAGPKNIPTASVADDTSAISRAASDPSSATYRASMDRREAAAGDGPLPFRQTALKVGISDDEVLNMPRWGIPDRITRSKVNGVWQEDWIYASRTDSPKRLRFHNARLAAIDTELAGSPQQFASVSLRQ